MTEEHVKKVLFTLDEEFNFECHKGLACYNTCCRDINIFLTPYDALRMGRSLGLSSGEFLQKYTLAYVGDDGIPLVALKMMEDQDKTCSFVTPDGCSIYQDRPWSCRMYPVFPVSSEEQEFLIEESASCLGFKEDNQRTTRGWKRDQDIDIYDKMNAAYKEITLHDYFQNGNKLEPGKAKLLYMACYDIDKFKKFLFGTKFFEIYDVEADVIEKIKDDDLELLSFAYRWVKFNLFSADTLKLRDKEMDKLLQSQTKASS